MGFKVEIPFKIIFSKKNDSQVSEFHCIKSVRIWSYSGPHFPAFGLITPNTDTFHAVFKTATERHCEKPLSLYPSRHMTSFQRVLRCRRRRRYVL